MGNYCKKVLNQAKQNYESTHISMVRIFWKYRQGSKVYNGNMYMIKEAAKKVVEEMNKQYPKLIHWYE